MKVAAAHRCSYVGPAREGSSICRADATQAIVATVQDQGRRLQGYTCPDHEETLLSYWKKIGYPDASAEPIRN